MRLEDYQPSEPCEVECFSESGKSTLVFVRYFHHEVEKVWSAITEPEKISHWAPFEPDRKLDSLGPVRLRMIDGSSPEYYDSEVLRAVENKTLEYSWGTEHKLCWELEVIAEERKDKGKEIDKSSTKLTLRHTVDDPQWITPSAAGWHMCLDFVEILMDGYAIGPVLAEAAMEYGWEKLAKHYGNVLGIPWVSESDNR